MRDGRKYFPGERKDIPPGKQKIDGKIFKKIMQVSDFKDNKNKILF